MITNVVERGNIYRCGTLEYSKIGMVFLFTWLLWGDFCYTVTNVVVPSIIQLQLIEDLGCSNIVLGVIMSTIPQFLNMTVSPYVAVKSDNCRSRWGRRLPFIITTLPFLCLSLVAIGWGVEIAGMLKGIMSFFRTMAPATLAVLVIGILMVVFQVFAIFNNGVFAYLVNDVVPPEKLGKFFGLFGIVGTGASALYNIFIFKYAKTHIHEIFLGAAIIYFVGIGLMCFMVKEGEYPPIDPEKKKMTCGIYGLKTYFKESFCHRFYWFLFISAGIMAMASVSWGFSVFFYREMGLSYAQIGNYNAIGMVVSMVATYFASIFVDRWHPLRVYAYICMILVIGPAMNWIWIFISLPGEYFFYLSLASGLLAVFLNALTAASAMPMLMRLFPQSRYGSFCSAQGIIRSFCAICSGLAFGGFLDIMRTFVDGNRCYRFNFCWTTLCCAINCAAVVWGYRKWNQMGGDEHFKAPAPWQDTGYEEVIAVKPIPLSVKYLRLALYLIDVLMIISLLIPIAFLPVFRYLGLNVAFNWFAMLIIPTSLLALLAWYGLARRIRANIRRGIDGQLLRGGLPHHGLLLAISIKFLLAVFLLVAQILVSMHLNSEKYAVIFAASNVITNLLISLCVWIICKVETGYTLPLDVVVNRQIVADGNPKS